MLLNVIDKRKTFVFTLLLIAGILLPAVSFASADKIFKENNKAVVVVVTYNAKGEPISQGSGFIVRPDGAVITNYHVISNAVNIAVKAGDEVLKVEGLLHVDKENDLVILKAKGKDLPSVKIGDIAKMNIGEKVYVISSPEGLENTVSDGILSGIREITSDKKILQITAPISPGSSGGPVFNSNGEVIGIATFIIKEAQNLNFAMPANLIKDKISSEKIAALKDAGIIDYTKTAEYWFKLGFAYDEAGLYDKAIEAYNKAIALNPNLADAYNGRGVAYFTKRQHDKAIENFTMSIALNPNDALAYSLRGLVYKDKRQYDKAMEDFNKVIAIDPNNANAYNDRGNIYHKKGQYDKAIEDFNKAIALNPNLANAYNDRGNVHVDKKQYDGAIADFDKAIAIDPNNAIIYYNRGLVYRDKSQHDKAIENYNKAIVLDPNFSEAYVNRGLAYFLSGNRGKAISDFQTACTMGEKTGCEVLQKVLKNR